MRFDGDEVQVWRVDCSVEPPSSLSSEEEQRARSFRHEADRKRFRACRAALRRVLAFHLGREASEIEFVRGEHGKLELSDATLGFNVAHSGDWGLIAVSPARPVGVDVERINPGLDYTPLLRRICSERERQWLESLPEERARLGFYRCWARKEALLKAMGVGLSISPTRFDVAESDRTGEWEIRSLPFDAGYEAAVAARGFDWPMRMTDLSRLEGNRT